MRFSREKIAEFYSVLKRISPLALTSYLAISLSCASSSIQWKTEPEFVSGYYVYSEPGIDKEAVKQAVGNAAQIRDELIRVFFPDLGPIEIRLAVYASSDTYDMRFRNEIESLANYRRGENVIHIPVNADESVWRHELSHAILEQAKPGSPFWLQEGLAYFVLENHFPESVSCDRKVVAKTAPFSHYFLRSIRQIESVSVKDRYNHSSKEKAGIESAISAYFVMYLWRKEMLLNLIAKYRTAHDAQPLHILSDGNPKKLEMLMDDFQNWLNSKEPYTMAPGC